MKILTKRESLEKEEQFDKVLTEYEFLEHAEKVPVYDLSVPPPPDFVLPAHRVVKEASKFTKLHVVFDALAKSSTSIP